MSGSAVDIRHVSKSFVVNKGKNLILDDISFQVKQGEIVALLGPSGCGKSTLLHLIGGFDSCDQGEILLDGVPVQRPNRRCTLLFQNYGLLPWRTVRHNVELALERSDLSKEKRKEEALKYLHLVGLADHAERFPRQLSGGMKQRVALARALVNQPRVLLMDEPFAALDTFNRYYLQDELLRIHKRSKTTIILVTHDLDEAVYLSDRILLMKGQPGLIDQELRISLPRPRDRGDAKFQTYRKLILESFSVSASHKELIAQ